VRSYLAVFPNVRVIAGPGGFGFYMIGSDGSVDLTADGLEQALARPGVLADVNSAPDAHNRSAAEWASVFASNTWASNDQLRALVGTGPLITDDHPLPEYFLLRRFKEGDNAPHVSPGALLALVPAD
jgi:hypothetical protein